VTFKILFTSLALVICTSPFARANPIELPELQVWPNVTVSGISSGAFFAIQMHLAHSQIVQGVGSIAGGPWNCAQGSTSKAQIDCMFITSNIDVATLVKQANAEAGKGTLAPLDNLNDDKIYLFNSPNDGVVKPPMSDKLQEFYSSIAPEAKILVEQSVPSAHGFPTLDYGNACSQQGTPWLQNCGVDTAGAMLTHLYTNLNPRGNQVASSIVRFNQKPFGKDAALLPEGFAYIPQACSTHAKKCRLHIAFHGCLMNSTSVKDEFAVHAGYNEWAESNDIVVLYPQADSSAGNPNGCWDWYGHTGADYATKRGPQIKAVKAMMDRLMSSPTN
jgi:poly(3-hydroxybutyrate) depolymerase